ncbi:hypothetical protein GCM10028824_43950 [Hymenobacter segetis]|uniref:Type II secretion system protein n=1 Tax=Hymenobacter segetis TaxID=2025509 RepID=A0ABU9LUS2_9BACT
MASLSRRRLVASSLVEVTVASVILVLVFSLAMASLTRLVVSGPQRLPLRARQVVARVAAETIRDRTWQSRVWHEGALELEQVVSTSPQAPYLITLRITAAVRGHEMAHLQQLVYAPPLVSP